jgi:phage/plasmid-associated DNA primase
MQPRDINMASLVDSYIEDCLTTSKDTWTRATDLYRIFSQYCEQLDVVVPGNNIAFGMKLSDRVQKRVSNGITQYAIVFKPEIFVAPDYDGADNITEDEE